jgi:hypothetical protein
MTGDGFGVSLRLKEWLTVNNNWLNRQLHDPRGLLFGILIFWGGYWCFGIFLLSVGVFS